ncbi:hypothetical protein RHMOL_Rhmol07G0054600 [Rhododendron molle]|uniref:Uncharacterized protein n=1 Tax=Rhododendron molle TaxID=49168 RepID=A0ACC0MYD1_RHOML|nr:hypothetical protein RHMOL_Rhmol07G0054600 [Rhododendron molle]
MLRKGRGKMQLTPRQYFSEFKKEVASSWIELKGQKFYCNLPLGYGCAFNPGGSCKSTIPYDLSLTVASSIPAKSKMPPRQLKSS